MPAFIANTNVLDLVGLHSEVEDTYINNAEVTVTVYDKEDEEVEGMTWPATMDYVTATNGNYRLILEDDLGFAHNQTYKAHIDANGGANRIGHWEFSFKTTTRAVKDA